MRSSFDSRVLDETSLEFIRGCQSTVECHLGGGSALAGAWLSHRLSRDIDLFCHDREQQRQLVQQASSIAEQTGLEFSLVRDGGSHVRGLLRGGEQQLELDIVFDPMPDLEAPPAPIDGIIVESLTDLRASKLTCLLSRSEPRDLVDVLYLERAGYKPEQDLGLATRKDAGIDPGILAWLMKDFPVAPMPQMLEELSESDQR